VELGRKGCGGTLKKYLVKNRKPKTAIWVIVLLRSFHNCCVLSRTSLSDAMLS